MFNIKYTDLVPYSVEQMFRLVNDINSYSDFVPGCSVSKILECDGNELIAELNIVMRGTIQSLVTHNFFIENKSIGIFLVTGPFKSFYGYWEFISVTDSMSRIKYISFYEFNSIFSGTIFNYVFHKIYRNIIQAFFYRARKIYGI